MASSTKYSHGAARLLMSTLFLVSGVGKLGAVKATQEYMEAYGVPGYLLYPAAALEIGGGLMLLSGVHTRWLALVLSGWCLLTAAIFHADLQDQNQKINLMKNMAMAGGFLVLADVGGSGQNGVPFGAVYRRLRAKFWGRDEGRVRLAGDSGGFLETADLLEKRGLREELPHAFDVDSIQRQYTILTHNTIPTFAHRQSTISSDKKAIAAVLQGYRDALVTSDTDAVMELYAEDSVLMAQNFPSVLGADNIRTWYDACFKTITLNVVFEIKEIVITSDEYAFASTTSAGTQKDNKTGEIWKEGNHELFVIEKVKGAWKLARYCFSTTNPA